MAYVTSLLNILSGKPSVEVVWTADISYWVAGQRQAGTCKPEWNTEQGYLELCRDLGIMPYYWYEKFFLAKPVYDDQVEEISSEEDGMNVMIWRTPQGDLRQESIFAQESCSSAVIKHAVETEEDLRILLFILQHRQLVPANLDDYHSRFELWKKYDGIPSIGLPRGPLQALFYEWAGVVNAVMLVLDHPEIITDIIQLMDSQEQQIIDAVCKVKPALVHFPDNMSSDNLTSYFDTYLKNRYLDRLNRLHEAGIKAAVHLDGVVYPLLPELAAVGFDAIEALTPQPVGDLAVEEMREKACNDTVTLWGGVPGAMFSNPFSWEAMEDHVKKLLDVWKGTRFVVGVADQVPPDGNIDYCKRIADIILK